MYKRKVKLIQPKLQVKLIGAFVGLSALALLLQFLLLGMSLSELAADLPEGGPLLASRVPEMLLSAVGVSMLLALPLIFGFGVLITHKIAGPVYRFEQYLEQIARGEEVGPCKIREGDEFQVLCEKLNEAIAKLRENRVAQDSEQRRVA
jgi:hypothetical protein